MFTYTCRLHMRNIDMESVNLSTYQTMETRSNEWLPCVGLTGPGRPHEVPGSVKGWKRGEFSPVPLGMLHTHKKLEVRFTRCLSFQGCHAKAFFLGPGCQMW